VRVDRPVFADAEFEPLVIDRREGAVGTQVIDEIPAIIPRWRRLGRPQQFFDLLRRPADERILSQQVLHHPRLGLSGKLPYNSRVQLV
jgi:hypothetical protein